MNNLTTPQPCLNQAQTLELIAKPCQGFVIFTQKKEGRWHQLGALPAGEVGKIYDIVPAKEQTDLYFTLNTYYRVGPKMSNGLHKVYMKGVTKTGFKLTGSRQEPNLQNLRCVYVDLDINRDGAPLNWRIAAALVQTLGDRGIIPHPTLFANSGRGAYAIWTIKPHRAKEADLRIYKAVNRRLGDLIREHSPELNPDPVHDAARVLRVPGSINTKAPSAPVHYLVQYDAEGELFEYTLEELAEKLGADALTSTRKSAALLKTVTPAGSAPTSPALSFKRRLAGIEGQRALGLKRLQELRAIFASRTIKEGIRYRTLFILASTARAAGFDRDQAHDELEAAAARFSPPYPSGGANDLPAEGIVDAAYSMDKAIRHTAAGLAKFFRVTADECHRLGFTTITPTPRKSRSAKRAHSILVVRAAILKEAGACSTLAGIAERLRLGHGIALSRSQISRHLKKLGLRLAPRLKKAA